MFQPVGKQCSGDIDSRCMGHTRNVKDGAKEPQVGRADGTLVGLGYQVERLGAHVGGRLSTKRVLYARRGFGSIAELFSYRTELEATAVKNMVKQSRPCLRC